MAERESKEKALTELEANLPDELNIKLREYHCANCGRFLALQAIVEGSIVIKCRRCKEINVLNITSSEDLTPL